MSSATGTSLERMVAAQREAALRGPRRPGERLLIVSDYKPWWAQRDMHRSKAKFTVVVAGRGVGKTHAASWHILNAVLEEGPGSEAGVLAPTFRHAAQAASKLARVAKVIPGATWVESKKELQLPGGRKILVFSADRKEETVRGPSLVFLWIDEGDYVKLEAMRAALPALRVGKARLLVTTTPRGGWVREWWKKAATDPLMARFRFRAVDSPYQDQAVIALNKTLMTADFYRQEYEAEFVDSLLLAFPHRSSLFVPARLPGPGVREWWLGVDLGRAQDWTVVTLIDDLGYAEVIGRWKQGMDGMPAETYYKVQDQRILAMAKAKNATVVLDVGGAGGSVGSVMAQFLRGEDVMVVEVKTNIRALKMQIVEQARVDVQWARTHVVMNEFSDQLDYEMERFVGEKVLENGKDVVVWQGPQGQENEHDDAVISFCLANWGRARSLRGDDPGKGLSGFGAPRPGPRAPSGGGGAFTGTPTHTGRMSSGGGYFFR